MCLCLTLFFEMSLSTQRCFMCLSLPSRVYALEGSREWKPRYSIDFITPHKLVMLRLINKGFFSTVKANIELLKRIRQETSAPLSQCQAALQETDNSYQQALQWLKKKGMSVADKHKDKSTREGVIAVAVNAARDTGVILEVNCETDFVAKNELFLRFVNRLLQSTLAHPNTEMKLVDITKAEDNAKAQDSFLEGMDAMNVFDTSSQNVLEEKKHLISKVQENIKVRRILKLHHPQATIGYYVHRQYQSGIGLQGCLVEILPESETTQSLQLHDFADNIATQILGAPPKYLSESEIPESVLTEEKQKVMETMAASLAKAPVEAHNRMIQGKLNAILFEPHVLPHMSYILSSSGDVTVQEYWKSIEHELSTKVKLGRVEAWRCK